MADPRQTVLEHIESLNKAMPDFRKAESTIKGLKAEVAAANVRIGAADSNLSSAELSRLIERYLDAW
jgi:type II secretory pathway component PulM